MSVFPGAIPPTGSASASDTLAAAGHTALHNAHSNETNALATKVGTGASTPTSGLLLRGNGAGTSAWAQVNQATDVTGVLPQANGGTGTTLATGTGKAVYDTSPSIATPTLSAPLINDFTNADHTHANNAGGGQLTGSTAIAPATITNALLSTAAGEIGAAWQSWTPTITAITGAFTTATGAGRYIQVGKIVIYQLAATITTIGTGTGCVFTLPVTAQSSVGEIGSAREDAITGNMGIAKLATTTTGSINRYENGNITSGGNGSIVRIFGFYEAA